jgi:hypothetical protein
MMAILQLILAAYIVRGRDCRAHYYELLSLAWSRLAVCVSQPFLTQCPR